MHKKVIERGRWASDWADNESVKQERQLRAAVVSGWLDGESLSPRSPMRPRRGCRKGLTDTLNPLRRFLQGRLGCLWDEVYRELREQLSPRSVIHQHIFQHLDRMVYQHVEVRGDRVYSLSWPIFAEGELFRRRGGTFYVHPETGRLCQPSRCWHRDRGPTLAPLRRIAQGEEGLLLEVEGLWYAVRLAPFTAEGWDVFSRAQGYTVPIEVRIARYGRWDRLAVEKRVLSRAEKRRAGLLGR